MVYYNWRDKGLKLQQPLRQTPIHGQEIELILTFRE